MGLRLFLILAVFAMIPAAIARDIRPRIDARVHEGGMCWDPDIEYPVPCDDDDD
jgi:hypothetical protein